MLQVQAPIPKFCEGSSFAKYHELEKLTEILLQRTNLARGMLVHTTNHQTLKATSSKSNEFAWFRAFNPSYSYIIFVLLVRAPFRNTSNEVPSCYMPGAANYQSAVCSKSPQNKSKQLLRAS